MEEARDYMNLPNDLEGKRKEFRWMKPPVSQEKVRIYFRELWWDRKVTEWGHPQNGPGKYPQIKICRRLERVGLQSASAHAGIRNLTVVTFSSTSVFGILRSRKYLHFPLIIVHIQDDTESSSNS